MQQAKGWHAPALQRQDSLESIDISTGTMRGCSHWTQELHDKAQAHEEQHMTSDELTSVSGVIKVNRHERFVDDLTGQPLCPEICRKARVTEPDTVRTFAR